MRNKLTILIFTLVFGGVSFAQEGAGLSQDSKINIYPNPVVEYIFIQLDSEFSNAEFELNSMIGNRLQIKPEEIGVGKYRISVKDLVTGYYFLIVKDEDKRFKSAYKFLKN